MIVVQSLKWLEMMSSLACMQTLVCSSTVTSTQSMQVFLIMLKYPLICMPYYVVGCCTACLILFDWWFCLLLTLPSGQFHSFHTCWMMAAHWLMLRKLKSMSGNSCPHGLRIFCFFLDDCTQHPSLSQRVHRRRELKGSSLRTKEFNSVGEQACRAAETAGSHTSRRSWESALPPSHYLHWRDSVFTSTRFCEQTFSLMTDTFSTVRGVWQLNTLHLPL